MRSPDGRHVFVWRSTGLAENIRRLTETLADICASSLFLVDGELAWFTGTGSVPIPAGRTRSREIIGKLIAGVRLVQQKGGWEVEYFTYEFPSGANTVLEPDELTLAKVLDDLKPLVARGPHALPKLTEQQWEEIRSRLKQGESVNSVSAYYRVDEAAIEAVAKYR